MMMRLLVIAVALVAATCVVQAHQHVGRLPNMTPELLASNITQYSGYFEVNQTSGGNMFYWFFPSQSDPAKDPVVLWLTGGPGCSSELAVLSENGPFTVKPDLTLEPNPYSWNLRASVIYVDSPVGTGFSYVTNPDGYVHTEDQVAQDLYTFLQKFFHQYPQFNVGQTFYVFGESYAGHYVPATSLRIMEGNTQPGENIKINMKGLAIGNGMTDPLVQYKSLPMYAMSHALIDVNTNEQLLHVYDTCSTLLQAGNLTAAAPVCNSILDVIQERGGPFNVYDVRKTCPKTEPLCYNFTDIFAYLALPSTREALHVHSNWTLCDTNVYNALMKDWWISQAWTIPALLNEYKVMLYAGRDGWICNFMGVEQWVRDVQWPGRPSYIQADRKVWMMDEQIAGYVQETPDRKLQMVVVNGAGHMVPHDQPATSLAMMEAFVYDLPLVK